MKKNQNSIKDFIYRHKVISAIIAIIAINILYLGYKRIFPTPIITNYVLTNVKKGDLITTITGTGQITASRQVELKSKTSGDIVYLNILANGKQVKKDTLIAQVDARDAYISLESARIAYAKLVKPATESNLLTAESALNDAIVSNKKSYEDAFGTITSTFLDLPTVIDGLDTMLYKTSGYLNSETVRSVGGVTGTTYRDKAGMSYDAIKNSYNMLLIDYKKLSRSNDNKTIEGFVDSTYYLMRDVSEALKNAQNAIEFLRKQKSDTSDTAGTTAAANVGTWTTTVSSDLNSLLTIKTTMLSSAQSIKQKTVDLKDLNDGPDSLDIRSEKLSLQQKENTYQDYFVRAPFDGLLARLLIKGTDTVSSGTAIGTLISSDKIATITLNEVDIEKVKVGQRAELTFDAVADLKIDGTVTTVDLVGTVSQGVVNYNVEISLDSSDERVKPGMSVSASIVTSRKEDVLMIPNSAVKTRGKISYVEQFSIPLLVVKGGTGTPSTETPIKKDIEAGISNDLYTEVISGITESEQVIARTVKSVTASPTTTTKPKSIFSAPGTRSRQ